ncbi:mitochondrial peroxiredoxin PRX1 [Dipodascopsis uninucleata]
MSSVFIRSLRTVSATAIKNVRLGVTNNGTGRFHPRMMSCVKYSAIRTFSSSKAFFDEQPRLRLGSTAPDFTAETTHGTVKFHDFIDNSWVILFSHPADFTPVCTTELGAFAQLEDEFKARNCKLIGLSANGLDSHAKWIEDIEEVASNGSKVGFPIIADPERKVAFLYDMVDEQDLSNIDTKGIAFTIRSVFIIDPNKKIRLTMLYPASTGRNSAEVLRVLDSLQTGDKAGITTPINWVPGEDVIVPPSVSDAAAQKKFGEFRTVKPYLRYTKFPL